MKILIYSDLHISRTSSILPVVSDNTKYTYRQNMIIQVGKYLADIAKESRPDMIINLGDTFDQHTVSSYDIDVASEFFNCFANLDIPHLVLVGNHEMINQDFNAIKLLNNINNIDVISSSSNIVYTSAKGIQTKLALLPYCNFNDILEFPEGEFLFSHQDIQGSIIRGDFKLPEGISPDILSSKYKLVFNGHIHKSSISNNIINVGSITTHSFSDDNDSVPQCYIFDTETFDLKAFQMKMCPLFRKFEIKEDIYELYDYVYNLDKSYKYILNLVCPFELKELAKKYLNESNEILNSRLNIIVKKEQSEQNNLQEVNSLHSNIDMKKTFTEFLSEVDLKYPIKYYEDILKQVNYNV